MPDSERNQSSTRAGTNIKGGGYDGPSVSGDTKSFESEQTSIDMLKNTPSNIRRLADEIDQCEGHQKYLAQTRSPSDGGDVRWYFCKIPLAGNELAASLPRTEVVGKGEYFRFGMRDSLAIEASFLQREEELLSSWWKEFAECSEGPTERSTSRSKQDPQLNASSQESSEQYAVEEERFGVPVKGGLFEVDLAKRHSFPVYWNGDNRRVLRGHWFARKEGLDWLPLREDISEQLEYAYRKQVWHRRTFQASGLFAARFELQGSTPGLHALFTGEDDTWEAWLNVEASGFASVIGFGGNGLKLRRGYAPSQSPKPTQDELRQKKEEQMDDYCSQVPVRHLVFMVHGIGQRLEKSNLVDDVGNFRQITEGLAERHLTSYQRGRQRVLFIPCQWRRDLKFSGEAAVEKCTLDGLRGLRMTLSATVHDVLYYMSPIYCQAIIDSVSNQLNRLYLKFLRRNPGYDGKVSLYGHSLGSVLSYDILCHQETLTSPFLMDWMYKGHFDNEESSLIIKSMLGEINPTVKEDIKGSEVPTDKYIISEKSTSTVPEVEHVEDSCAHEDPSGKDNMGDEETCSVPTGEYAEYSCALVDPTGSSISDEHSSSDEDALQAVLDQSAGLDDSVSMSGGVVSSNSNNTVDEVCQTDEGGRIKVLEEEIDCLHAKIRELESQINAKGHDQDTATVTEKIPSGKKDTSMNYTPSMKYTKLEFKVDTFFAAGAPLGVFLALRNVRIGIGKGQEYWEEETVIEEMPACRQILNIFHPFDPVAYRLEPLICKDYVNKRPVIIPYHRGGKRLHIGYREFAEKLASRSQAVMDKISYVQVKVLTLCQSGNDDSLDEDSENIQDREERTYGSIMMERLTGSKEGRVDHVLQDKTFQHAYISVIGAHTNYWRDYDTALFMLKHLYRDTPDEPHSSDPPKESSSSSKQEETDSEGWSDEREAAHEELPLTFADKVFVRNFSQKANKIIKKR